jgi:chromosome segregation ATPase
MVKFLLELGIDPSKMSALEVEDKLQEVRQKLREGFEAAQKEIETKEREIAKKQYDAIDSLDKLIAPQEEIRDSIQKRIDELRKELEPVKDYIRDLASKEWDLREEIGKMPEVIELRNNASRMKVRFDDYMDILDKEAKSLTKYYVRKDLSDAVKSMKQLGVKKQ